MTNIYPSRLLRFIIKLHKIILQSDNPDLIYKLGICLLYEHLLTQPSLINFLQKEMAELNETKKLGIMKICKFIKIISDYNPTLKIYQWFLLIISSSLNIVMENTNNNIYPVPEKYQIMYNFNSNMEFFIKAIDYYEFLKPDTHIIGNKISNMIIHHNNNPNQKK